MSLSPPSQNRGRSSPTTCSEHRSSFLRASSERTTPPEPTKHPLPQTPPLPPLPAQVLQQTGPPLPNKAPSSCSQCISLMFAERQHGRAMGTRCSSSRTAILLRANTFQLFNSSEPRNTAAVCITAGFGAPKHTSTSKAITPRSIYRTNPK